MLDYCYCQNTSYVDVVDVVELRAQADAWGLYARVNYTIYSNF